MCGVKRFIYLVQQSCEVVVLPPEERQTCVSEGGPPLLPVNSKASGYNRGPCMQTSQEAAQC